MKLLFEQLATLLSLHNLRLTKMTTTTENGANDKVDNTASPVRGDNSGKRTSEHNSLVTPDKKKGRVCDAFGEATRGANVAGLNSTLLKTKANRLKAMESFGTLTTDVAGLKTGDSQKSVYDIVHTYRGLNEDFDEEGKVFNDCLKQRSDLLQHILPKATAAAANISELTAVWIKNYNSWSELKFVEAIPHDVAELSENLQTVVDGFTKRLSECEHDAESLNVASGGTISAEEARWTTKYCLKLLSENDSAAEQPVNPTLSMYACLPATDLHKFASRESFRLLLQFAAEGEKDRLLYYERVPERSDSIKDYMVSVCDSRGLRPSEFLTCAAVIGDNKSFAAMVGRAFLWEPPFRLIGIYDGTRTPTGAATGSGSNEQA